MVKSHPVLITGSPMLSSGPKDLHTIFQPFSRMVSGRRKRRGKMNCFLTLFDSVVFSWWVIVWTWWVICCLFGLYHIKWPVIQLNRAVIFVQIAQGMVFDMDLMIPGDVVVIGLRSGARGN